MERKACSEIRDSTEPGGIHEEVNSLHDRIVALVEPGEH